jgi:hypothetical protein
MATKRKATLKQLFKAWLRYQQKSTEVLQLKWGLDDLANQTIPGTELIAHGDDVYRITTSSGFAGRVTYKVDRIAVASELQTLK